MNERTHAPTTSIDHCELRLRELATELEARGYTAVSDLCLRAANIIGKTAAPGPIKDDGCNMQAQAMTPIETSDGNAKRAVRILADDLINFKEASARRGHLLGQALAYMTHPNPELHRSEVPTIINLIRAIEKEIIP
jgi:hypothetical protein